MNPYLLPLALGALLLGALAATSAGLRKVAHETSSRIDRTRSDAMGAEAACTALERSHASRQEEHAAIRAFLAEWRPHLPAEGAPRDPLEQVRNRLQQEASRLPVATSAWTAPPPVDVSMPGARFKAQPFSVRVAGDLDRVLTWLGRAEELFPAARFKSVELAAFGSGVALDVSILLPLEMPRQPAQRATP